MAGRPGELAGWLAIFTDGAPAPSVTSFNGGIFLAVAIVDRALKGSMAGERMNKRFGREVREKEMS
jgi:hypothetical protein